MRAPMIAVIVAILGLLSTVWLPFVNTPALWLGIPSVMLWTILWVLALSAALAWVEFGTHHRDDDEDWTADVRTEASEVRR